MEKLITIVGLILLFTPVAVNSEEVGIEKLVEIFLENNFDIKLSELKKQEKDASYDQKRGEFDHNISYQFTWDDNNVPTSSALDGGGNAGSVKSKTVTNNVTYSHKFQSGLNLEIPYTYNISQTGSSFSIFPKSHEPTLAINLDMEWLRPFWKGYAKKDLLSAQIDIEKALAKYEEEVSDKLFDFIEKVYDYLEAEGTLKIMSTGLIVASNKYLLVKKKRKVGQAGLIDEMDARSAMNKAKERKIRQDLKRGKVKQELLDMLAENDSQSVILDNIKRIDKKLARPKKSDMPELIKKAAKTRKKAIERKLEVKQNQQKEKFARYDKLPSFTTDLEYESKGLAESYGKGNSQVTEGKFVSWKLGATVEQDMFRYAKKGALQMAKLKTTQAKLKKRQFYQEVGFEIQTLVAEIEGQQEIIAALKTTVAAEKTKFNYADKRLKLGKMAYYEWERALQDQERSKIELLKAELTNDVILFKFYKSSGELLAQFK